jgi:hypothetical protein
MAIDHIVETPEHDLSVPDPVAPQLVDPAGSPL